MSDSRRGSRNARARIFLWAVLIVSAAITIAWVPLLLASDETNWFGIAGSSLTALACIFNLVHLRRIENDAKHEEPDATPPA
jgi:hypothetical protein